jgi:Family of unknown function (DUF6445)
VNNIGTLVHAIGPCCAGCTNYQVLHLEMLNAHCRSLPSNAASLHPNQCLPHIDTIYPLQFAILHFLCGKPFSGTAFFQQTATGFECISPDRSEAYETSLDIALSRAGRVSEYTGKHDRDYSQIARFDEASDRTLIYASCILHSWIIVSDIQLIHEP